MANDIDISCRYRQEISIFVVVFGSNLADSTALLSIYQYRNLLRGMASLKEQHEIILTSVR